LLGELREATRSLARIPSYLHRIQAV
jgi:hypothetical protein